MQSHAWLHFTACLYIIIYLLADSGNLTCLKPSCQSQPIKTCFSTGPHAIILALQKRQEDQSSRTTLQVRDPILGQVCCLTLLIPAWITDGVPGQPGPHRKVLYWHSIPLCRSLLFFLLNSTPGALTILSYFLF